MSQNLNPSNPLQPLNIGNVVSAGIVLYRSHLKSYMGIAFQSVLWSFLPFLVLLLIGGVGYGLFTSTGQVPVIFWLFVPVWLIFLLFCFAKYLLQSALLSRLAFKDLSSQPETIHDARQQLNTRLWSFLWLAMLIGLLMSLVYLGLGTIGGIVTFIITFALANIVGQAVAGGISLVILFLVIILGLTWFFSRWIVSEVVLAIEDGIDVGRSVSRSWELTEGSVIRIQGVVLITFLITLPLLALTNYFPSIILTQLEPLSSAYFTVYGISLIASFAGWILLFPLWQSVKSVLYYDLRNRREGLGLQLRDSIE